MRVSAVMLNQIRHSQTFVDMIYIIVYSFLGSDTSEKEEGEESEEEANPELDRVITTGK